MSPIQLGADTLNAIAEILPPANACVAATVCKYWNKNTQLALEKIKKDYFVPEHVALLIARKLASHDPYWSVRSVPRTQYIRNLSAFEIVNSGTLYAALVWKRISHSKMHREVYFTGVTNRFYRGARVTVNVRIDVTTMKSGTITLLQGTDATLTKFRKCNAADALLACGVSMLL
jgi:hypothetical protein